MCKSKQRSHLCFSAENDQGVLMEYSKNLIKINKELRYRILSTSKTKDETGDVVFNLNYGDAPAEITYYNNNILVIANPDLEIRINTKTGQLYYKTKKGK